MWPSFPASAIVQSLSPSSTSNAPSVAAVIAAFAAIGTHAPVFTTSAAGLVPTSPGGTTSYLRADGTWAVPPGGGGGGGGDVASVFGRTGAVTAQSGDYSFAQIGSKPTTLAGYGIVDAAASVHSHADVVEGGASGYMTGAMATKLAGIAVGATQNSSDATLLARANHTGTQVAATIQDFSEAVDDRVAALLVAGSNITLNYNDGAGTLTISAAGGGGGATLADGDYGDLTASSSGTVLTIDPAAVTLAKMADLPTQRLIGRATAGTGVPEQLTVTGGIEFTAGGIQTSAYTGDVTKSAGGTATTIAAGAVTYAKMQSIASDTLIGRDTAGSGVPEAITLNATLEFTGAQAIQRAALTGDVTAGAGSNATTIAAGVVTLAKMANLAQDQVIGRVTASTGVPETFTVTAAARSVLDDTTVDAMLNTLGGGTATGTGVVVRANTPTLITPVLGAATGTSLALGGGTALTTTNRTGTGNLVLNTDPTLTRPVFSGITVGDGSTVTTANAMGALAIDVTKGLNTKSISVDSTLTFSGTPATANTWFSLHLINTDGAAPHTITIPSSYSMARQAAITSFVIPANGQVFLTWRYDGSGYKLLGESGYLNKYDATTAPGVGDDVADGYGPGSLWLNATSNIAYICESASAGAAVWNQLGGGVADGDYGMVSISGGVWSIDDGVVTMAKLANIATDSLIGRDASGTGVPTAISVSGGLEFSGTDGIRRSALTGDVTASAGSNATTIANAAVSLAKMADLAASRFIGRVTASTGVPESMTGTQATTLLDVFTTSLKGLAPASGGGTTNFLRADGTWAAPAGGGTVTNTGGNLTNNLLVLGAGTTDTKVAAGFATDGTSKLTLGVSGASVGGLLLANATSGTVEIRPVTGALGSAVISAPAATDTMVLLAATQTLTNKTLTAPVISTISNTGTLTLPTSTDTLVGRATTDTLTNKTLTSPRVGTAILDTNGNELIDVTATGSAVNQLGVVNAATGNAVQVTTAGGDTNISLNLVPKGTGELQYAGAEVQRLRAQNSQSAAYTTVLADRYLDIVHPSADTTARVFTIDSNANVPYPVGTRLIFINQNGAGVLTIAITSDTQRLAGAGTTGSRTLAANGMAVWIKVATTEWICDGVGLT